MWLIRRYLTWKGLAAITLGCASGLAFAWFVYPFHPQPKVLTQEQFDKWSGRSKALLDHATPNCWVLVTDRAHAAKLDPATVRALSDHLAESVAIDDAFSICYFCQDGQMVEQVPACVVQLYLQEKTQQKKGVPLRTVNYGVTAFPLDDPGVKRAVDSATLNFHPPRTP